MATEKILLEFQADIKDLKKQYDEISKRLDGIDKKSTETASSVTTAFKKVGKAIGAAFTIREVSQFISKSIQLAAEAEGVRRAFEKLNDATLLNKLREATRGTVSDLELMKNAVKANNFKLPLEQLATYFQFASQRARDTGESVDYLVESIVLGISRKSIPILDNLGISATQVQEEFQKTGDFAQAVGNIINNSMSSAGEATDTLADSIEQTRANIVNLQVEIGDKLAPAFEKLLGAVDWTVDAFRNLSAGYKLLSGNADFVDLRARRTTTLIDEQREAVEENKVTIESLTAELSQLQQILQKTEIGTKAFYEIQTEITRVQGLLDSALGKTNKKLAEQRNIIKEADGVEQAYKDIDFWLNKLLKSYEAFGGASGELILNNLSSQADIFNELNFLGLAQDEVIVNLTSRYNEGLLTQEQYNDLIRERIELLNEEKDSTANVRDEIDSMILGISAAQTLFGTYGQLLLDTADKQSAVADFGRQLAFFEIASAQAVAVANAVKVASNSSLTAVDYFVFLATILSSIGVTIGKAKSLIEGQSAPQPAFAEGVVDLKGAGTETSDSIHARLSRGESVITAKGTRQDKGLFEAANKLKLEQYINENYVLPALLKKKKEESSMFDDYRLYLTMMKGQRQDRELNSKLISAISRRTKRYDWT